MLDTKITNFLPFYWNNIIFWFEQVAANREFAAFMSKWKECAFFFIESYTNFIFAFGFDVLHQHIKIQENSYANLI